MWVSWRGVLYRSTGNESGMCGGEERIFTGETLEFKAELRSTAAVRVAPAQRPHSDFLGFSTEILVNALRFFRILWLQPSSDVCKLRCWLSSLILWDSLGFSGMLGGDWRLGWGLEEVRGWWRHGGHVTSRCHFLLVKDDKRRVAELFSRIRLPSFWFDYFPFQN